DPTYLVYTLGKLEILKLRDDYRKMKGGSFSLQEFHDGFLTQGFPPVKIVRRALLGNDSPVLCLLSGHTNFDRVPGFVLGALWDIDHDASADLNISSL